MRSAGQVQGNRHPNEIVYKSADLKPYCAVPECGKFVKTMQLCGTHYQAHRRRVKKEQEEQE